MKFIVIEPGLKKATTVECKELQSALIRAGLNPLSVDFGVVRPGLGIVVAEFGMYDPPDKQCYFALGRAMFAGNAVLYGFNESGETIDADMTGMPLTWLPTREDCELAFASGAVVRPAIKVNDVVIWAWP